MGKKWHRALTIAALLLVTFLTAMEATVVATVMPTVVSDLGGLTLYGWVGAAYLISSTVATPIFGKLADVRGRRLVLFIGLAVFLLGSMGSGASTTMPMLIAFRALQGIGAGAVQPVSLTILGDLYPVRERARVQALFGAVWGLASIVGPLLGGILVKVLSWRWVFYVNLPFGILPVPLLLLFFHETFERRRDVRFDWLGAVLMTLGLVALLFGAGRTFPLVMFPAAFVLLGAFAFVESRAAEPIFPLALLKRRILAVSAGASLSMGAVMMVTVIFVPLYVQSALHRSPTEGGLTIGPMLLGWPVAGFAAGRLVPRFGYRPVVRAGFACIVLSQIVLALLLRGDVNLWLVRAAMLVFGLGMGATNTSILFAVQESVQWEQRGVATASTVFFRATGGALAVGAMGALLAAQVGGDVSLADLGSLVTPVGLAPALEQIFAITAGMAVVAGVTALIFPRASVTPKAPGID